MESPRTYELYAGVRVQLLAIFAVVLGITVYLVVETTNGTRQGPSLLFTAAWLLIALWNGYWMLFRVSALRPSNLRFQSPASTVSTTP